MVVKVSKVVRFYMVRFVREEYKWKLRLICYYRILFKRRTLRYWSFSDFIDGC